jgi:molybdopterin-containing oxidoreductase family iron-sulfur binding subunit
MNLPDPITATEATGIDRREFLRLSSALAAAGALASAACQVPPESSIPFHDMPESLVDGMGRARFFHTVLHGSPVMVRTREGRPILVTPVADDASGRGLSVRHHAALMDLYDPDRVRGPLVLRRGAAAAVAANWNAIGADVVAKLREAGPRAVLLTAPTESPTLLAAIRALSATTGLRHVVWSPLACDARNVAWSRAFAGASVPRPRLDRADLVLGLGAEFLDRPEEGLERDFAQRRSPDQPDGTRMSRFVQLEGRLSLTGANADHRIRVRDSQLAVIGAALAHELIVVRRLGSLAGHDEITRVLAPFAVENVAGRVGLDAHTLHALADELAAARGKAIVLAGGSASASTSGSAIELSAILLNVTLGAFDGGLFDESLALPVTGDDGIALPTLAAAMAAGDVKVLIAAGANPVYDAPASLAFADALSKVPFVVSLNDRAGAELVVDGGLTIRNA